MLNKERVCLSKFGTSALLFCNGSVFCNIGINDISECFMVGLNF